MRYYSDKLDELFESVDELEEAELEYDKEQEEGNSEEAKRQALWEEVEEAREASERAHDVYMEKFQTYSKTYPSRETDFATALFTALKSLWG